MIVLVALIILIVLLVGVHRKRNEYYWKKRGVVFWRKSKTLGVFWHYVSGQKSMFQIFDEMYREYSDASEVAFGTFLTPSIFVKNLVNIHHVTIIDFQSFSHRGLAFGKNDKLANNVALLHGPKWKIIRQAMSPLFTPAKIKKMHYIVDKCAQDFIQLLKRNPNKLNGDAYMTMKTYCCAALTGAVFGIGTESPFESPFIKITSQALAPTLWSNIKFMISGVSPQLFNFLGLSLFSVQEKLFTKTIKQVIEDRKLSDEKKHDFVDLCVNLQNGGVLLDSDTGFQLQPTHEIMAAQAFIFFMAGLEPCAAGLFGALFELGRNPEMQKRLQRDIDAAFEKYDGEMTYDAIMEMKYLDKVIKETLRMYPPVGFLTRECVRDTKLPVGNIKIDAGTKVYLPIYSQHNDSKYFPDPEVFDPERFSNEKELADVFIPFGQGSRICLGLRYAYIQIKTGIVHILRHFDIEAYMRNGVVSYKKEHMFVRLKDVDLALVPRKTIF